MAADGNSSRDSVKLEVSHQEDRGVATPPSRDKEIDVEEADDTFDKDIDHGFLPSEIKRITRKIDRRLIPILSAMYCISLIDRTNLSLAQAANNFAMRTTLGLAYGQRYTIVTVIFFVPYIILEVPCECEIQVKVIGMRADCHTAQVGLRKFGARWWLGTAVILWGIVMMCMGFVRTWNALAGLRALLGVFEAVLFPGAAFLIACWYPRKQMALRNTAFYVMSVVVSGLSATLAYGLSQMHGTAGKEGVSTCSAGHRYHVPG
jgi:MFS family permease